jgi:hypothetical protein
MYKINETHVKNTISLSALFAITFLKFDESLHLLSSMGPCIC